VIPAPSNGTVVASHFSQTVFSVHDVTVRLL